MSTKNQNKKAEEEALKQQLETEQLQRVIAALRRVDPEIQKQIKSMADKMRATDIIKLFNQDASDLFAMIAEVTRHHDDHEVYRLTGYKNLFDNAIKIKASFPVDKFTLIVLEYVNEFYDRDEDFFLSMEVPETKVTLGNEFGFIRTEMFRNLWKSLNKRQKNKMYDKLASLTTYAHAYFCKTAQI